MLIILGGDSISKTTIQYEIVKKAYFNTSYTTPFFKNVSVPVPVLYAVSDFWGIKKAPIRVYQYRKIHRNIYENPVVALTCHALSAIIMLTKKHITGCVLHCRFDNCSLSIGNFLSW